jgi:hypothetical protein
MTAQSRLSERLAVVATIDPDAYATGAEVTDVIDMMYRQRVIFIIMAGTLASTATLDFLVKGDTASGGSYATTITGKSITQLTEAGTDSDKQVIVEVTAEEVFAQGFRYIRGTMTLTAAGGDAGVIAIAGDLRYQPANDWDLASVDEIVG